ncbi:MAG: DNA gyrase subunit A, partial [Glaciihabitans sp.]
TLGLRDLLQVYIDHRLSVVIRRSQFRLARRRERLHLVEGLLLAILDIDEVIQVIRSSDDGDTARRRLMDVFDLSQIQAEYILELRLRRLTKFSLIELEGERDRLLAEIAELEAILADRGRIRQVVSDELDEIAERFGTPRRTLLTEARPSVATTSSRKAAPVLELADIPCRVYLSTTGRIVRVDLATPSDEPAAGTPAVRRRSKHDAIRSMVETTSRTELGAITNLGRLVRFSPIDLPSVPENSIQLGAGVRVADYITLASKERVVGLVSLTSTEPFALGTRQGVVKRVTPGNYPNRPEFEVIALKPGDEVVGVNTAPDGTEFVFITSDAQLLRFFASTVRPQGPSAGGMAGINLGSGAEVIFFGVVDAAHEVVVATVSGTSGALAGADVGRAKVSVLDEFPAKGRATGGVRAHAFLKGEDKLLAAWAGPSPARALAADGAHRALPEAGAKRDASGAVLDSVVATIGGSL